MSKQYTLGAWMKALARSVLDDSKLSHLGGSTVADVAERLGVSRQAVDKLIAAGHLETIEITTKRGVLAMRIVTDASLERYLEARVPYSSDGRYRIPQQLDLVAK